MALLPLFEAVHFPHTELRLQVVEPEYCRFFEQLSEPVEGLRLGTVLLKSSRGGCKSSPVHDAGTGGRLLAHRRGADGCEIVIRGEFRFAVDREIPESPCRHAWVRRLDDSPLCEQDPEVRNLRRELVESTHHLAEQLGSRFEVEEAQLHQLKAGLPFETMVNHLAANMDMAPQRKLQLLKEPLPVRAEHLLNILRERHRFLDALRPYRHLAVAYGRN